MRRTTSAHTAAHHLLSGIGIALSALFIVGSFIGTVALTSPGLLSNQLAAVVSSRLVSLTNEDRSQYGLQTLTVDPVLTAAAQAKANDMAAKGYFAHVSPEGLGSWHWFRQVGYSFKHAGENLAVDFTDSAQVNQAWLDSPTHRANILNGKFTHIGIATTEGEFEGRKTTFVVQMFGTPATTPTQAPVTTTSFPNDPREPAIAEAVPSRPTAVLGVATEPTQVSTTSSGERTAVATGTPTVLGSSDGTGGSWWAGLVAAPRDLLRGSYFVFGALLALALILRTRLEIKLHHTRHVAAVFALFVLMVGLMSTADRYVFTPPIIGEALATE
jgi:uncharacterized protein YkwD